MRALIAIVAGCVLSAGAARATTVFSDHFSSGAKPDWGNESGQWRGEFGTYDAAIPGNGQAHPVTYSSVTTSPALKNFSALVQVKQLNDGGVWLHSSYNGGQISGVLLVTGGESGSYNGFYWHVVQNGAFSAPMGMVAYAGAQGATLNLRITVIGGVYSLYVGGSKTALTSITTHLFPSGAFGLYDYSPNSGAGSPRGQQFDNVTITAPTPAK